MSAGKVEIGCYRTFPESYIQEVEKSMASESGSKSLVPPEMIEEFGIHAHKYYQLQHSFFKSKLDLQILDTLWNEYWIQTLSSSPLLNVIISHT
jgi:COP9 signalosome complex subunit 5